MFKKKVIPEIEINEALKLKSDFLKLEINFKNLENKMDSWVEVTNKNLNEWEERRNNNFADFKKERDEACEITNTHMKLVEGYLVELNNLVKLLSVRGQ